MVRKQRGDTLVEVLMSTVILSLVIVGAITVMARGLKAAQLSVEHTQVRLQINAQLQILRYLRDGYISDASSNAGQKWSAIFTATQGYANTTPAAYNDATGTCNVTSGKTGFYLTQAGGNVAINQFNPASAPVSYAVPGQGLWIEMTRSTGIFPAYVDILLRGCWSGIGDSTDQSAVTAIRLYDPAH